MYSPPPTRAFDPSAGHSPTNDDGRIKSGAGHQVGNHRSRRRLAVSSRDRDSVPVEPHQLGEHLGARNDRHLPAARVDDFGVVAPTADEQTTTSAPATFAALWPSKIVAPIACSRSVIEERFRSLPVTTKVFTERQKHFGDAAHADPADPHEVNMSDTSKKHCLPITRRFLSMTLRDRRIDLPHQAAPVSGSLLPSDQSHRDDRSGILSPWQAVRPSVPSERSFVPRPLSRMLLRSCVW